MLFYLTPKGRGQKSDRRFTNRVFPGLSAGLAQQASDNLFNDKDQLESKTAKLHLPALVLLPPLYSNARDPVNGAFSAGVVGRSFRFLSDEPLILVLPAPSSDPGCRSNQRLCVEPAM